MSVSFNTIPSGLRVPLFYAEMDNSQAATPSGTNQTLLIGQMTADGTADPEAPIVVSTATQAKSFFGRGSQLARMVDAYRKQDAVGQLVCIALEDASSATPASCTITLTGTATESGSVSIYIGADRVQVGVASGDEAEDVANAIKDAITANADLPVTATAGSGVVTLNAKNKGALANDIRVTKNLRGVAGGEKDVQGLGVEISTMSGGATDPEIGDAIAVMGDEAYEYIGVPYSDTAVLDAFKTEMDDSAGRWSYARQLYGHVYTARRGELNTLITFGSARNNQHETVFAIEQEMPSPIFDVIGAIVGRQAVYLNADPARPTQTGPLTGIMASPVQNRFILSERQSLLTNGMATLGRLAYTSPVSPEIYEKVHAMRSAELDRALEALPCLSFFDGRFVIAGTSEGGVAAARHAVRPDLSEAGRLILSWSCEDNYHVEQHRTAIPLDMPVLNVMSAEDKYFSRANAYLGNDAALGHAGRTLARHHHAAVVLIPGAPHTLYNEPEAFTHIAAFLEHVLA